MQYRYPPLLVGFSRSTIVRCLIPFLRLVDRCSWVETDPRFALLGLFSHRYRSVDVASSEAILHICRLIESHEEICHHSSSQCSALLHRVLVYLQGSITQHSQSAISKLCLLNLLAELQRSSLCKVLCPTVECVREWVEWLLWFRLLMRSITDSIRPSTHDDKIQRFCEICWSGLEFLLQKVKIRCEKSGDSIQSLSLMTSHCCFCSPIEYFASQWANSIFSRTPSPIDSVSEQVVESFISSLSVIEKDRFLRWKQHMTRKKFLSRLLHDNVFLALSSSSCSRVAKWITRDLLVNLVDGRSQFQTNFDWNSFFSSRASHRFFVWWKHLSKFQAVRCIHQKCYVCSSVLKDRLHSLSDPVSLRSSCSYSRFGGNTNRDGLLPVLHAIRAELIHSGDIDPLYELFLMKSYGSNCFSFPSPQSALSAERTFSSISMMGPSLVNLWKNSKMAYASDIRREVVTKENWSSSFWKDMEEVFVDSRVLHDTIEGDVMNLETWIHLTRQTTECIRFLSLCRSIDSLLQQALARMCGCSDIVDAGVLGSDDTKGAVMEMDFFDANLFRTVERQLFVHGDLLLSFLKKHFPENTSLIELLEKTLLRPVLISSPPRLVDTLLASAASLEPLFRLRVLCISSDVPHSSSSTPKDSHNPPSHNSLPEGKSDSPTVDLSDTFSFLHSFAENPVGVLDSLTEKWILHCTTQSIAFPYARTVIVSSWIHFRRMYHSAQILCHLRHRLSSSLDSTRLWIHTLSSRSEPLSLLLSPPVQRTE